MTNFITYLRKVVAGGVHRIGIVGGWPTGRGAGLEPLGMGHERCM